VGARESKKSNRACPICTKPTSFVAATAGPRTLALDVCTYCRFVWFDPTEYAATPRPTHEEPTTEAGRLLAHWEEQLRGGTPLDREIANKYVDKWWKWIPPVLGMPAEQESIPLLLQPWVTWALAAVITAVTLVAFFDLELAITRFGLIPAHFWRYGGLTFLSSFLLHAGLLHLLGNLYFLMVFGDNVEDFLGRSRYLLLVVLAALAGDVLSIGIDPHSTIPSIGASGGISGVVVFYGLQFPRARLLVLLRFLFFYPLPITAITGLLLWFVFQAVGVQLQLAGFTNINHLAHLGGGAVGVLFWALFRNE